VSHQDYGLDANGSVEELSGVDGERVAGSVYLYDPYGESENGENGLTDAPPLGQEGRENPFRFEGFYYDSGVKTYDMHARHYQPQVGRFLSQDRFESALGDLHLQADPLTQNRYAFAGGNPVNRVEFDGHRTCVDGRCRTFQTQDGNVYNVDKGINISGPDKGRGPGAHPGGRPASAPPRRTASPDALPALLELYLGQDPLPSPRAIGRDIERARLAALNEQQRLDSKWEDLLLVPVGRVVTGLRAAGSRLPVVGRLFARESAERAAGGTGLLREASATPLVPIGMLAFGRGAARGAAGAADDGARLATGRFLSDSWRRTTFPNKMQSVRYHWQKHVRDQGINKSISEYTEDALSVFRQHRSFAQQLTLKDGTPGLRIKTGQGQPGGIFTPDGRVVTFWYR
jgi:RHS repeat-associated protein